MDSVLLRSVSALTKRLSLSENTIRGLIEAGELRAVRIGRAVRVPEGEVARLIRRRLVRTRRDG